jgi:hypothetical protein
MIVENGSELPEFRYDLSREYSHSAHQAVNGKLNNHFFSFACLR